jgi:CO dehydrogenase nickel-insertion accessory protein CooC1
MKKLTETFEKSLQHRSDCPLLFAEHKDKGCNCPTQYVVKNLIQAVREYNKEVVGEEQTSL